jgi:hypothetical protein
MIFTLNRKLSRKEGRPVKTNLAGKNWNKQREVRLYKSYYGKRRSLSARVSREMLNEDLKDLRK